MGVLNGAVSGRALYPHKGTLAENHFSLFLLKELMKWLRQHHLERIFSLHLRHLYPVLLSSRFSEHFHSFFYFSESLAAAEGMHFYRYTD